MHGTVLDRHQVDWLVHGADRVFHLAAAVGVRRIVEQPLQSLRVNIHGTENVLEAARAARGHRAARLHQRDLRQEHRGRA